MTSALADAEAAEHRQHEAEAALHAARSAEATATRTVAMYEGQVRDLQAQLAAAQAAAGAREDDLRAELEETTAKWQRAAAALDESGLVALAHTYGIALPEHDGTASPAGSASGTGTPGPSSSAAGAGDSTRKKSSFKLPAQSSPFDSPLHMVGVASPPPRSTSGASGSGGGVMGEALLAQLAAQLTARQAELQASQQ